MEYLIILVMSLLLFVVLAIVFEIQIKKIKKIADNKELNELVKTFPENKEICEKILNQLENKTVKIKEDKESSTNLYMIYNDTIVIANIKDTFTRIQTIAHECLHSVQSKKMLWFNFIYTNIYIIYFVIISILTIFKVVQNPILQIVFLILFGMIQYAVRSFLETDAMTRAPYVVKEYLEQSKLASKEEIQSIMSQYHKLNELGIKVANYDLLLRNEIKLIIYLIICIITYGI